MRIIYRGKLIETDKKIIDDRRVIDDSNYESYQNTKIDKTWNKLKEEMGIPSKKHIQRNQYIEHYEG